MLCHGKRMDVVRYEDMKVAATKGSAKKSQSSSVGMKMKFGVGGSEF